MANIYKSITLVTAALERAASVGVMLGEEHKSAGTKTATPGPAAQGICKKKRNIRENSGIRTQTTLYNYYIIILFLI